MRRMWPGLHCLVVGLFVLSGCWSTAPKLKRPDRPEEYVVPPGDDPRFSAPIAYPPGTLNKDEIKKEQKEPGAGFKGPSRPGGIGSGY
jgi:hypothetical protein